MASRHNKSPQIGAKQDRYLSKRTFRVTFSSCDHRLDAVSQDTDGLGALTEVLLAGMPIGHVIGEPALRANNGAHFNDS